MKTGVILTHIEMLESPEGQNKLNVAICLHYKDNDEHAK